MWNQAAPQGLSGSYRKLALVGSYKSITFHCRQPPLTTALQLCLNTPNRDEFQVFSGTFPPFYNFCFCSSLPQNWSFYSKNPTDSHWKFPKHLKAKEGFPLWLPVPALWVALNSCFCTLKNLILYQVAKNIPMCWGRQTLCAWSMSDTISLRKHWSKTPRPFEAYSKREAFEQAH